MEPEDAESTIREFNAFFRFIGREYSLPGAAALVECLNDDADRRLAKELGDASHFGMAKSFMSMGLAVGFDMRSPEGLAEFTAAYNNGLLAADDTPSRPEPPVSHATPAIRRDVQRTGRNDPCPCGSGLKYKKCCLQRDCS